jgi:hypothetical protein
MTDSEIAALLRAMLEQFRDGAEEADVSMRPSVATGLPETAATENSSLDELRRTGHKASRPVPTMWR